MILTVSSIRDLRTAFDAVGDGDTIRILPGYYTLTPKEPLNAPSLYAGGAALVLDGKMDVTVEGIGIPELAATAHGSILCRQNCLRCHVRGVKFSGCSYTIEPKDYYFALVLYNGKNEYCDTKDCIVMDSGDHGIAELHLAAPPTTDYCRIERNRISRCGMLVHATLGGDGAGVAMGGSHNTIADNVIESCLRGIEVETRFAEHATVANRIERNRILHSLWQAIVFMPEHGQAALFSFNEVVGNYIEGLGKPSGYAAWGQQEHGIVIQGGQFYRVSNNTIVNLHDWWGIEAESVKADLTDCDFTGNVIAKCERGGIWLTAQNGHTNARHWLADNRIRDVQNGIWVVGDAGLGFNAVSNFSGQAIHTQPS